jgi:transposase-like protein
MQAPKTLLDAIKFFSNYENCRQFMIENRWAGGVVRCPRCGSDNVLYMEKSKLYFCRAKHEKAKFSLKVGTVMEDSPIGLEKWLPAFWLLTNCRNGISSYELARAVGVTQKSAWHMLGRIRAAMEEDNFGSKLGTPGPLGNAPIGKAHDSRNEWEHGSTAVEVDEAFIGGKISNMHRHRAEALKAQILVTQGEGYEARQDKKVPVLGMFDRQSRQVRAKVVGNVRRETLQKEILRNVKYGSAVYTDEAVVHETLRQKYVHETVNHAETYVNGQVHTNSLENFWSLLKRNLAGTYVAVEPFHLDRYLAEQCFRFNTSKTHNDGQRFAKALSQIVGKKLTYAELTGKDARQAF